MKGTVATLHRHNTKIFLDFGVSGNKYFVSYDDMDHRKPATTKYFKTAAQATEVYQKIAGWILLGCYSDTARREYLLTGTMK